MRILICPDKYKGSISALGVCEALRDGLLAASPDLEIALHPMADGGDGSIEVLRSALSMSPVTVKTVDPIGRIISADYYESDDVAFIELASASGIALLEEEQRDPMKTWMMGTGLMIADALDRGITQICLFIGGSATNDAGMGIAQALGFQFLDHYGKAVEPIGENLIHVRSVHFDGLYDFENINIQILCDVTNPMYGPSGAAYVYGPQKGGTSRSIEHLDHGLRNFAQVIKEYSGQDLAETPGMGAAGAVGASLVGLMNARLQNGFDLISELTQLEQAIQQADLVITGEGKVDQTSFDGKVVGNVLALCKKYNKPCGIVGGAIETDSIDGLDIAFQKSIIDLANDLDDAMTNPSKYLKQIGEELRGEL